MTVRFARRGLEAPGVCSPYYPACPTRPTSQRYLQVPAGRLQEEAGPILLGARHRHELPQSVLPLRRHLRPVRRPNCPGSHCTASARPRRSALGLTGSSRVAPARRPRPIQCLMQNLPCGKRRRSAPSGGRSPDPQSNSGGGSAGRMRGGESPPLSTWGEKPLPSLGVSMWELDLVSSWTGDLTPPEPFPSFSPLLRVSGHKGLAPVCPHENSKELPQRQQQQPQPRDPAGAPAPISQLSVSDECFVLSALSSTNAA
ncbi:hypothetical protein Celaphus_00007825 [Cervus elaphus hippelaphus]|uniref:Uncharacterized protein n=1 Tax=Cervus elaphus hippelaphus TaxID=46360 RepID=A0A212CBE1_CEREH|nr:hypothetical protein Celaphus_00007825 [Cervus elaphus hippelaphus]